MWVYWKGVADLTYFRYRPLDSFLSWHLYKLASARGDSLCSAGGGPTLHRPIGRILALDTVQTPRANPNSITTREMFLSKPLRCEPQDLPKLSS
jgi:hypothetical protein